MKEEKVFYKIVCVSENDPFEYKVLEDVNRGSLEEVHEYVKENIKKYKNAKWMLLPYTVTVHM